MKKLTAICLLLLVLMTACKTKKLEYLGFENPRVLKMGFPTSTVALDVACYNPNKFGLKLTEMNSDVYINNEYLGKAFVDSTLSVPGQDTFLMPVKMNVKMGSSVNGLLKLINGSSDTMNVLIRLEGKARLLKGGIHFNYPIKYEELKTVKF